jgi:hypothetical protein
MARSRAVNDWAACCGTVTAALPDSLPDFHDDFRLNSCGTSLVDALSSLAPQVDQSAAATSSPTCDLMQTNSTRNLVASVLEPARFKSFTHGLNYLTMPGQE